MKRKTTPLLTLVFSLVFLALLPAAAQTGAPGRVSGRVFNPATGEFVRNAEIAVEGTNIVAFSGDDGSYALPNVPAGDISVSVTYTGYDRATAKLTVAPGATAVRDFELKGSTFGPAAKSATGEVVRLDKFVVSNEREGNAKAIMEQRAALNMKSVVASDNFGDVTGGNVGEFVKYLPGVVIDYNNADARAVRISGLDPKYAAVSIDGMRMASAASATFGATTRQFEFEQASISSVESIELNKTLTASMDADAPAGSLNLRSRNAFDRKGREVTVAATVSANPYDFTLSRTPGPGDGVHRKIRPGAVFTYSESFNQRFGIQLSISGNQLYNEQAILNQTIDTSNATRGPVINALVFRDNPKITSRSAIGLNLDYKVTPGLVVALRTSGSHFRDEINSRVLTFRAASAQIDPSSTLTYLLAQPTANANTRLESAMGHSDKWNDTVAFSPKVEYKRRDLTLTAAGGYSRSTTHYEDRRSGYWASTNNWITRMSWSARRSSSTSPDWQFTRVSGPDWSDPASYNRSDANPNNIGTAERTGRSQVWSGGLDAKQVLNLGLPVTVGAGLKSRLTVYDLWKTGSLTWTYVGPARNQLAPGTVMLFHPRTPGLYDPKQGDNIDSLNLPVANATAMYELYRQHPEYFIENEYGNYVQLYTSPRAAKEQVDAGYVELNTRWNQLRLNLGARQERTRTVGRNFDLRPAAQVRAAGYTANTIPYVAYQYRGFERSNKYGGYDNTFFSGGAKYSFSRNLVAQLSASQAIGRPDYNNVAGAITINDTNQTIRIPNPDLKPETSDKYFVSVQYYIEPAGTLSVSAYRLNVKNMGLGLETVSSDAAGYADDPQYAGYTFQRTANAAGTRRIDGTEVEYSQQLVFLPGFARGFSVFGSISRAAADTAVTNLVPKAANGGLRFSNHLFNAQLRCTWASARLTSISATQTQWEYERLMFDFSGGYKMGRAYEVTISGRNIANSPIRGYVNEPRLMRANQYYGAVWTLGVRGRF